MKIGTQNSKNAPNILKTKSYFVKVWLLPFANPDLITSMLENLNIVDLNKKDVKN